MLSELTQPGDPGMVSASEEPSAKSKAKVPEGTEAKVSMALMVSAKMLQNL